LLDARNAISVTERTGYIGRIRMLASRCCAAYAEQRREMGLPFTGKFDETKR
jgi:glycyl-tRNA synthetase alpha chain